MAGLGWTFETSEIESGTSRHTIIQVTAPTNQRLEIDAVGISFKGTDPTATPAFVEFVRQSSAGSGGSAITANKDDPDYSETVQTTGLEDIDETASTQPTEPANGHVGPCSKYVPTTSGYEWQAPFGRPITVDGGGRFAIVVTTAASVLCVVTIRGKE